MSSSVPTDLVNQLKIKYKNAFKSKVANETEVCKLRQKELVLNEDLTKTNEEEAFYNQNLMEIQKLISETRHQVSIIEICKCSEKAKIETQLNNLNQHRKGFQDLFLSAQQAAEKSRQELEKHEKIKQGMKREKNAEINAKNEQLLREAILVEAEADSLLRECAVLKKRNAAVMLKLRKKLIETEEIRRKLMRDETKL